MSGNQGPGGKAPQEKAGSGYGIMGKVGKLDTGVRTWFPDRGVGEADQGKHNCILYEEFVSDNPPE